MASDVAQRKIRPRRWLGPLAFRQEQTLPPRPIPVPPSCLPDGWFAFERVSLEEDVAPVVLAGVRGVFAVAAYAASHASVDPGSAGLTLDGRMQPDVVDAVRRQASLLAEALDTAVHPLVLVDADRVREGWVAEVRVVSLASIRSLLVNAAWRRLPWDEFKRIRGELRRRSG